MMRATSSVHHSRSIGLVTGLEDWRVPAHDLAVRHDHLLAFVVVDAAHLMRLKGTAARKVSNHDRLPRQVGWPRSVTALTPEGAGEVGPRWCLDAARHQLTYARGCGECARCCVEGIVRTPGIVTSRTSASVSRGDYLSLSSRAGCHADTFFRLIGCAKCASNTSPHRNTSSSIFKVRLAIFPALLNV